RRLCMKGKYPLYSSIIGLIIFILIMVGVYSGVKTAFDMLFISLVLIFVVYLLFRYLQEILDSIMAFILIVIDVQVIFKLWLITIMLLCYLYVLLLANYVIRNKKWSSILMNTISILYGIILFYIVLQKNL